MKHLSVSVLVFILLVVTFVYADGDDPAGNWCRNEDGNLVDLITVTRQEKNYTIRRSEGWDKPVYSEGTGVGNPHLLQVYFKNKTTKATVWAGLHFESDTMTYLTHDKPDGPYHRMGDYCRCRQ